MSVFTWDPNSDQSYTSNDGDQSTLNIDGAGFSKNPGKNFTMDAKTHALTLNSTGGETSWGFEDGRPDARIEIVNGSLVYNKVPESHGGILVFGFKSDC